MAFRKYTRHFVIILYVHCLLMYSMSVNSLPPVEEVWSLFKTKSLLKTRIVQSNILCIPKIICPTHLILRFENLKVSEIFFQCRI